MTTDAVANNNDEQLIERQPVNPDSHGQSVDSERAEPADESREVNAEQWRDAERSATTVESATSEQAKPVAEAEDLDCGEDFLRMYEAENEKERKNSTTFKVTQIRSHSKIEKRETTLDLPDGITPDDINVDLCFEGDAGFENAGHEPCEIKTDWEILERSRTDFTLGVKLDIRKSVVKDFAVTPEELIVLGLDYLERAYDLEMPHGYPWDRRDRWDYIYSWERYEQIEEYIAQRKGIPCLDFEAQRYAYEKLLDKANAMTAEEWHEQIVMKDGAWAELKKEIQDNVEQARLPPLNQQLKNKAIESWEERKERASKKQREAELLAGRTFDDESSTDSELAVPTAHGNRNSATND